MEQPFVFDVSAVVCTLNSKSSIEECLRSLLANGVVELIVVDGGSVDGTVEVAEQLANNVLRDEGKGLAQARNIGIAASSGDYVLNVGSDNVFPVGAVANMVSYLQANELDGVSALTVIPGNRYWEKVLRLHRAGRYKEGPVDVIGTPTLFVGDRLRSFPYDESRRFSDDSELCERWSAQFGSRFAISNVEVLELGKASWSESWVRGKMYGISDDEIFQNGKQGGWGFHRKVKSIIHPLRVDFIVPLRHLRLVEIPRVGFGFLVITILRYVGWFRAVCIRRKSRLDS